MGNEKLTGKLEVTHNGVVIFELTNPISTHGVNSTLSYQGYFEGHRQTFPWPLGENGEPLPIELSLRDIALNTRLGG